MGREDWHFRKWDRLLGAKHFNGIALFRHVRGGA